MHSEQPTEQTESTDEEDVRDMLPDDALDGLPDPDSEWRFDGTPIDFLCVDIYKLLMVAIIFGGPFAVVHLFGTIREMLGIGPVDILPVHYRGMLVLAIGAGLLVGFGFVAAIGLPTLLKKFAPRFYVNVITDRRLLTNLRNRADSEYDRNGLLTPPEVAPNQLQIDTHDESEADTDTASD